MNNLFRSFRGSTAIVMIPILLVVVLAAIWVYKYSSSPQFCSACHLMETRYAGWGRSTHASSTTCLDCHSEPGVIGELKAHMNGARYVWMMATRKEWSGILLKTKVHDDSCLKCHQLKLLGDISGSHVVNHQTHANKGVECVSCHDSLSHGTLGGTSVEDTMDSCDECHVPGNDSECVLCHTSRGILRAQLDS